MIQPRMRNGRILSNEEQPTDYLLSYVDSLLDEVARRMQLGSDSANVHLNTARDVIHILQEREGWRQSGDGGYK